MNTIISAEAFFRKKSFPVGISDEDWEKWKITHKGTNWQGFAIVALAEYAEIYHSGKCMEAGTFDLGALDQLADKITSGEGVGRFMDKPPRIANFMIGYLEACKLSEICPSCQNDEDKMPCQLCDNMGRIPIKSLLIQLQEAQKEIERLKAFEPTKTEGYMTIHSESRRNISVQLPKTIPMIILNEEQAKSNHGQSLERLNARGGLGVGEILDIIHRRSWGTTDDSDAAAEQLLDILKKNG